MLCLCGEAQCGLQHPATVARLCQLLFEVVPMFLLIVLRQLGCNRCCTQAARVEIVSLTSRDLPSSRNIVASMVLLLVVGKAMRDGCKSAAGGAASNWFEE